MPWRAACKVACRLAEFRTIWAIILAADAVPLVPPSLSFEGGACMFSRRSHALAGRRTSERWLHASAGGIKTNGTRRAKSETWKQKRANMRASVCMRVRVRVRVRVRQVWERLASAETAASEGVVSFAIFLHRAAWGGASFFFSFENGKKNSSCYC